MQLILNEELSPELRRLLEENRAIVEATIKPYVEITLEPHVNLTLWQSKVGGFPYFPKDVEYPIGKDETPLQLLAQINFAEVPQLQNFPEVGILQFYTAPNHDLYGADYDHPTVQDYFRVLYFSKIQADENQLITDFSFIPEFEYGGPASGSAALRFEKKFAPISTGDYQFDQRLGALFAQVDHEVRWEYDDISAAMGHRLGGYPSFTQTDPREWKEAYRDYQLLFQLDSDSIDYDYQRNCGIDIMWGDCGIANFFIKEEALKNLDFSDVLYNWDCS